MYNLNLTQGSSHARRVLLQAVPTCRPAGAADWLIDEGCGNVEHQETLYADSN